MRHYEILANGCIPYFFDLENCPPHILTFLPKNLILEAMRLPGVAYRAVAHSVLDETRYYEILGQLLAYAKKHLTCRAMAKYVLDTIDYCGKGRILYLSKRTDADYLREQILIGLKKMYGSLVTDYPKIPFLYKNFLGNEKELWGKGFSYTRILDDFPIDRSNIEERIRAREFDLIVYGSVHRGMPFYDLVLRTYSEEEIVYLCGEDYHDQAHPQTCEYSHLKNIFLREYY